MLGTLLLLFLVSGCTASQYIVVTTTAENRGSELAEEVTVISGDFNGGFGSVASGSASTWGFMPLSRESQLHVLWRRPDGTLVHAEPQIDFSRLEDRRRDWLFLLINGGDLEISYYRKPSH